MKCLENISDIRVHIIILKSIHKADNNKNNQIVTETIFPINKLKKLYY